MIHLLNGDALLGGFQQSGIQGAPVIWREGLASGPTRENVSSQRSFSVRSRFWSSFQALTDHKLPDYQEYFGSQIQKLSGASEVTLWFEHDLFCQINMLAAISHITTEDCPVFSITLDPYYSKDFRGLGTLDPEQLKVCGDNSFELSTDDKQFASELWHAYNTDPLLVQRMMSHVPPAFPYLQQALKLHLSRFPGVAQLPAQFHLVLSTIRTPSTFNELMQRILTVDINWGFGDLIWNKIIKDLGLFYAIDNGVYTLNEQGNAALQGNFRLSDLPEYWLGGVQINDLCRYQRDDRGQLQLVKSI